MNHLFSLDYWTRTWMVQEFLLAEHVEILCGSEALDLKLLDEFFADLFSTPNDNLIHSFIAICLSL